MSHFKGLVIAQQLGATMMKYTLQILPNYQAPKDVLHFIWHEMESAEEPVFNLLSTAIWGLASVFNFLMSAIVVVLFFTILTALKLVEFGINLALFLCKGLWYGIKNIFESLSELYQSGLSPGKLSPDKWRTGPLPRPNKPKRPLFPAYNESMFDITLRRKNRQSFVINTKISEILEQCSNFITKHNLTKTRDDKRAQLNGIYGSIDSLKRSVENDLSGAETLSAQNIWKLADRMLSNFDLQNDDEAKRHYDSMNRVFKSFSVNRYIELVKLRVKNCGDSFAGQLIGCELNDYTVERGTKVKYDEKSIAIKAYMVISCFDVALNCARERKLFDDGGTFDHSDDSSDNQSEYRL
ncbi:MAG: hypothetical protein CMF52_07780 [Legionellales bacterium]|nr:hypothetical protein [Legionellales bacterium]HAV93589.1 hypothetical protein [Pseudomonadota bacterium]